jgi:hypothetical protein
MRVEQTAFGKAELAQGTPVVSLGANLGGFCSREVVLQLQHDKEIARSAREFALFGIEGRLRILTRPRGCPQTLQAIGGCLDCIGDFAKNDFLLLLHSKIRLLLQLPARRLVRPFGTTAQRHRKNQSNHVVRCASLANLVECHCWRSIGPERGRDLRYIGSPAAVPGDNV